MARRLQESLRMMDPVDPVALQRLLEAGGRTLLERMVELFLENTPLRLSAARIGVERGDWPAVERAAHSLKSSAAYLGLPALRAEAERIEDAAREGGNPGLAAVIDELIRAYPSLSRSLLSATR